MVESWDSRDSERSGASRIDPRCSWLGGFGWEDTEPGHNPPEVLLVEDTRFSSKTEEKEEDPAAGDGDPSGEVDQDTIGWFEGDPCPSIVVNSVEAVLGIGPGDPWSEVADVHVEDVGVERDGGDHVGASESHETEVSVDAESGSARLQKFVELAALLQEGSDGESAINAGDSGNDEWPNVKGGDGYWSWVG